jgi:tRNA G10  N-methylase Trm11
MIPVRPIHAFPARMAPEIAMKELQTLPPNALVLDPMMGSGTVLRLALNYGLRAIGRDVDPLAVLMARVWTTPIDTSSLRNYAIHLIQKIQDIDATTVHLPWIDQDPETASFIDFWFNEPQKSDLRKISYVLHPLSGPEADFLRLALSRIIVTKDIGASLARDVSHSRPHRVRQYNSFSVMNGFINSVTNLAKRLASLPPTTGADVRQEDARSLTSLASASIDAVITSPPYLNAIDYLRGHRLALVWLGHRLSEMRSIRSTSIGAERALTVKTNNAFIDSITKKITQNDLLPSREQRFLQRYILDLSTLLAEIHRVTRPQGKAVFVIGNSCLHGVFIKNSLALLQLAEQTGFRCLSQEERELPPNRRYLPPPQASANTDLNKRMRTETIFTFVHD